MSIGGDKTRKYQPLGYILLDALLAIFLFSLGFSVLYGLTEGALVEARQASSLMEAANLAQKEMDQLSAHSWRENINRQACLPGGTVEGREGNFRWLIRSDWDDIPQLLRVSIEVRWIERGSESWYLLESLYEVE